MVLVELFHFEPFNLICVEALDCSELYIFPDLRRINMLLL